MLLLAQGLYRLLPQEFPGSAAALLGSQTVFSFALVLFLTEFVITKIPMLDRFWELAQTLLRPVVGAVLAISSVPSTSFPGRVAVGLAGAAATLAAHVTKSTTRLESTAATSGWTHLALSLSNHPAAANSTPAIHTGILEFRDAIMSALEPFPDAYQAMVTAFRPKPAASSGAEPVAKRPEAAPNRFQAVDSSPNSIKPIKSA